MTDDEDKKLFRTIMIIVGVLFLFFLIGIVMLNRANAQFMIV